MFFCFVVVVVVVVEVSICINHLLVLVSPWSLAILRASLVTSRFASLVSLEASGASLEPVQAQPTSLASLESSQGGNYSQEGKQSSERA